MSVGSEAPHGFHGNLPEPLSLDVTGDWPAGPFDGVFSANTAHIMGLPEVGRMFLGVGQILAPGAPGLVPVQRGRIANESGNAAAGVRSEQRDQARLLATPTLWLTAATLDALADAIVREPTQAPMLLMATARQAKKPYHQTRISDRAQVWHEALSWAELPAADALRCYARTTDLVSAFATAATSEAAAEKELAYQTLLG